MICDGHNRPQPGHASPSFIIAIIFGVFIALIAALNHIVDNRCFWGMWNKLKCCSFSKVNRTKTVPSNNVDRSAAEKIDEQPAYPTKLKLALFILEEKYTADSRELGSLLEEHYQYKTQHFKHEM